MDLATQVQTSAQWRKATVAMLSRAAKELGEANPTSNFKESAEWEALATQERACHNTAAGEDFQPTTPGPQPSEEGSAPLTEEQGCRTPAGSEQEGRMRLPQRSERQMPTGVSLDLERRRRRRRGERRTGDARWTNNRTVPGGVRRGCLDEGGAEAVGGREPLHCERLHESTSAETGEGRDSRGGAPRVGGDHGSTCPLRSTLVDSSAVLARTVPPTTG